MSRKSPFLATLTLLATLCLPFFAHHAGAATYTGLSLSTPYPDRSVVAGQPAIIPLTVKSFGLEPQQVKLNTITVPKGWTAEFQGDARSIGSVFVGPDESRDFSLQLIPGKEVTSGTYTFELGAEGTQHKTTLAITLRMVKSLPDWLTISAALPTLKGSVSTQFSYDVQLSNKSGRDATINFSAEAPPNFDVTFSPQYGSENVTAMLVKAGENKAINVKVTLPGNLEAGDYRFTVRAASGDFRTQLPLAMTVGGKADLTLSTPSGQLSGEARIGKSTTVSLTVTNNGSAPARNVTLSAQSPNNWKVVFDPKVLGEIAPKQTVNVSADVTPADQSLAGDYMVTFQASSGAGQVSANYRVTVLVSTLWGMVGLAIAALAMLVVGFAVVKFGRR